MEIVTTLLQLKGFKCSEPHTTNHLDIDNPLMFKLSRLKNQNNK